MADLIIKNVKNVALLEFDIPREGGVHLITGANGCGKTTLMTCLERLKNSYAFQKNFKTSANNQFDSFKKGEIVYSYNGATVSYRYKNSRWTPTPRSNANILSSFGFSEVIYVGSDVERFYVQDKELRTKNIQAAQPFFKDSMNNLFDTQKFTDLRRLKIEGKGRSDTRRNIAFILPDRNAPASQNIYFSEKNFSLGEVLVLNLLYQIFYTTTGALLLIDEIELALHPKVQIRLLAFLRTMAEQRQLTVLISTHSSSLIKSNDRCIYLERNGASGVVTPRKDCYPAIALKEIAFAEDFHPDYLFCVEDDQAEILLQAMIRYYFQNQPANRLRPEWKVIPIGGWSNVIRFRHSASSTIVPPNVKVHAILDQDSRPDVHALIAKGDKSPGEIELFTLIQHPSARIAYLPITPEQGIMQFYQHLPAGSDAGMQTLFEAANLNFSLVIAQENQTQGTNRPTNPRAAGKAWLNFVVDKIHQLNNWDKKRIQRALYDNYVLQFYQQQIGQLSGIMGPLFN